MQWPLPMAMLLLPQPLRQAMRQIKMLIDANAMAITDGDAAVTAASEAGDAANKMLIDANAMAITDGDAAVTAAL